MTVLLLTDRPYKRADNNGWVTIPAGSVVSVFDAATEAGMIAAKTAAASAAAVTWFPPSETPDYVGLTNPEADQVQALVSGALNLRESESVVPIALYGDSRANLGFSGVTNAYDMRTWITTTPTGTVAGGNFAFRAGAAVQSYYPAAKLVANCGVSGDTLAQMVTRETAGASATRKSIADAWSVGARVMIVRAGINSITSLVTAGYVQATADTIIAARQDLIQRAVNAGFLVIDEGEAGYDYVGDSGAFPQSRIDAIRRTITAVNEAAAAFAGASDGSVHYLDTKALTCDSTGQWLTGMCEDTASPGQRVHQSAKAADIVGSAEAALLSGLFRFCAPSYVRYATGLADTGNLLPNANLSASTGGLGTGWGTTGSGSSPVRTPSIITRGGKRWQALDCTFGAAQAGSYGAILIPIPIHSGGSITVAENEVYGFEVDLFADDGNGGAPPVSDGIAFGTRIRIYSGAPDPVGNIYYDAIIGGIGAPVPGRAWQGKAIFNPVKMAVSSASILGAVPSVTTSTYWQFAWGNASGLPFRIGASSPRMVKLA